METLCIQLLTEKEINWILTTVEHNGCFTLPDSLQVANNQLYDLVT